MTFNDMPRKEFFWLIVALCVPTLVMANAAYQTYVNNQPETIEFKVFETNVYYYPQFGMNLTQVLTWGTGKFYFQGSWDNQFFEGHTYQVTFVHKGTSRPHLNLIVIEWEDIT